MKRIGILGGTFNPVHNEHVELGKSALKELNLDKLIVMPTYISPHKDATTVSCEDRLNMLKIAFDGIDGVEVSDYEILKGGKSYTYQTVEYFNPGLKDQLYFIVGGDMLTNFKSWKYPERILNVATLAVFDRENFFTDYSAETEYFEKNYGKQFIKLNYKGKDASSTKIRILAEFGLPLSKYTPKGVEEYIKEKNLYPADKYVKYVKKCLPEKRLVHTAGVVISALKKAKKLGLDEQKVKLTAVLHDCAKYVDYNSVKDFVLPSDVPQPVAHAFLGAYVAQNVLGVTDQEVIDAIRYHSSGKADMTTLNKLIYVADIEEENRSFDGVEELRELYEKDDFESCFIECLKHEFLFLLEKKQPIYQETINAVAYYIKN